MLRLLELPDLPGVGEKPWGEIDLDTAHQQYYEAGVTMQMRGWATVDENRQPIVEPVLKQLLSYSAYPSQMTAFVYKHAHGPVTKIYHYRRSEVDIRHTVFPDSVHEFQVLPHSDMGQADILGIFEDYAWNFTIANIKLVGEVYDQAVKIAIENGASAEKMLIEAGILPQFASKMTEVFAGFDLKVSVQWVYELNPHLNMSSAIFWVNKTACWVAETTLREQSGMIKISAVDNQGFRDSILSAFQPFRVV